MGGADRRRPCQWNCRQQADYDNAKIWVSIDARDKVADAQLAFESWAKIRTHAVANEYLLSLLIGAKRE